MIPTNFEYFAPATIEEALALLDQYGDDCKILSGGQSLVPVLKLRLAAPAVIIDIGRISALKSIDVSGDLISIGASVTHGEIAKSSVLRQYCPLLTETAVQIGDQQVRNRGTIGGSLAHADPAADWPAAILALDAEIVAKSSMGQRVINATDFFIDLMTSAVAPNEIVTEIRLAKPAQPARAVYLKSRQAASGFAIIGVAAQLAVNGGKCEQISVGISGLSPRPYRALSVEMALRGAVLGEGVIKSASQKADAEALDAMGDIHASEEYRRHLAKVYSARAIQAAAAKG